MAEDSSRQSVRLSFVNQVLSNRVFLVRNPVLLQGDWTESPDAWKPANTVPWQETQIASAEGERPTGVQGQVALEIPADGVQSPVSQVTFLNDATGFSFLIDGNTFKTIVVGDDVFFATLTSSLNGSRLEGRLTMTGGSATDVAMALMRSAPTLDASDC